MKKCANLFNIPFSVNVSAGSKRTVGLGQLHLRRNVVAAKLMKQGKLLNFYISRGSKSSKITRDWSVQDSVVYLNLPPD